MTVRKNCLAKFPAPFDYVPNCRYLICPIKATIKFPPPSNQIHLHNNTYVIIFGSYANIKASIKKHFYFVCRNQFHHLLLTRSTSRSPKPDPQIGVMIIEPKEYWILRACVSLSDFDYLVKGNDLFLFPKPMITNFFVA